ncbi:MAG: MinD/ParA family ATP-binding protein [Solirubrobacteraceae bacterium]
MIALDGNPNAGSLAYRVRRETSNTITELLAHRNAINRDADIRAYTPQAPTRLEVIAADDHPRITRALVEQDFHTAIELLEVHYNLVRLNTGTGVLESASKRILQLVPQTAPWRHVAQKQLNSIVCVATGSWPLDAWGMRTCVWLVD